MRILALEKENPRAASRPPAGLLESEAARAWALHQEGVIRELYFRADRREAVLVLECAGESEALVALESLPLVSAGLIAFEVIPLVPYDGFASLFKTDDKESG